MRRLALVGALWLAPHVAAAQPPSPAPAPSDAELQAEIALSTLAADQTSSGAGPKLDVYGFADFNYFLPFDKNSPWWRLASNEPSFAVGNLNLYFDANL